MRNLFPLLSVALLLLLSGCRERPREVMVEIKLDNGRNALAIIDRELGAIVNRYGSGSSGGGGPADDGSFNRKLDWDDLTSAPLSVSFQRRNISRTGGNPYGLMISWRETSDLKSRPSHAEIANALLAALRSEGVSLGILQTRNLDYVDGKVSEQK